MFGCVFITLCFSTSCKTSRTYTLPETICSQNIDNAIVMKYYDTIQNFTFNYFKGFNLNRTTIDSVTEYSAISKNGALEHHLTIINLGNSNVDTFKIVHENLQNDSTRVIGKEWRNLYGSKIDQNYNFSNGIAVRTINDSLSIKGLIAIDAYVFKKTNRLVIVKAIDFCKTTSSNNIEPIFSLNRQPNL